MAHVTVQSYNLEWEDKLLFSPLYTPIQKLISEFNYHPYLVQRYLIIYTYLRRIYTCNYGALGTDRYSQWTSRKSSDT